jgi:hypothetical protein
MKLCKFVGAIALAICGTGVHAQVTVPAVRQVAEGPGIRGTASEAWLDLTLFGRWQDEEILPTRASVPLDSMRAVMVARARRWIDSLMATGSPGRVRSFQRDAAGRVAVASEQDSVARRIIAARLAEPGLSLQDSAATYAMAVEAFTSGHVPERLRVAEGYLARLDRLGGDAAVWQMEGHLTMLIAAEQLRRPDDVIAHGMRACALVSKVPYELRRPVYTLYYLRPLLEAVQRTPSERATVEGVLQQLRDAAEPSVTLMAINPKVAREASERMQSANEVAAIVKMIGQPAPALIGNWWSAPEDAGRTTTLPSPRSHSMTDGHVHVVSMPVSGNPFALGSLAILQRVQSELGSAVHVVIAPSLDGAWGYRFVPADEEAKRLTDVLRRRVGVQIPLVFNITEKVKNADGGIVPASDPNWQAYNRLLLKPAEVRYLIDRGGRIRHVIYGGSLDAEQEIMELLQTLVKESQ